jgi:hypothetical protein
MTTLKDSDLLPLSRTPVVHQAEVVPIDLMRIATAEGLEFFTHPYKKTGTSDGTPRWFVHERGEETGLSFALKHEMSEAILRFSLKRLLNRRASLVAWGGQQGLLILTVLSDAQRKAKEKKDADRARSDKAANQ